MAKISEPPPNRNAAQWCNAERVLPAGTPEAGPMKAERAPYVVAIMEAAADPRTELLTTVMGSQMSKSETGLSLVGHKLDDDPQPVMYVGPTKQNLTEVMEPRVQSMIDSSQSLKSKFLGGKKSTKTCKRISGVTLRLAHAGSPTELASNPAALAIVDELDRMHDLKGEGSVLGLVDARLSNYVDSLRAVFSTPTIGSVSTEWDEERSLSSWKFAGSQQLGSPSWIEWQSGSREEWAVPCPECNEYFIPRFSLLSWDKPEKGKATPDMAERTAKLACECCGSLIDQKHQTKMNEAGLFVGPTQKIVDGKVVGELETYSHRSFWVSGLMSPWRTWGQRAAKWIDAVRKKNQGLVQTTMNTGFGELYAVKGEAPEWQQVKGCAQEYTSTSVPADAQLLFATVDVQKDRLYYTVRAWGYAFESWLIECGELWGETDLPHVWKLLDGLLERQWGDSVISAIAVDSGYRPDHVYDWCNSHKGIAYATKGVDRAVKTYSVRKLETNKAGRIHRRGQQLWTIDASHWKAWVHDRIRIPQDEQGSWHVYSDIDEDYCRQIVAETRIVTASGHNKWLKVARDNHYLDCEGMQAFLARMLRVADLNPVEAEEEKFVLPKAKLQKM